MVKKEAIPCEMCTKEMKALEAWHPLTGAYLCSSCMFVMEQYLERCAKMILFNPEKEK
jgi:hypothetical protein